MSSIQQREEEIEELKAQRDETLAALEKLETHFRYIDAGGVALCGRCESAKHEAWCQFAIIARAKGANLSDHQQSLLMFLKSRQSRDNPAYFFPHRGVEELAKGEDGVMVMRITEVLDREGIPLDLWDGLPLGEKGDSSWRIVLVRRGGRHTTLTGRDIARTKEGKA